MRINVNKKRLEISLKKSIDPGSWDNAAESIKWNKPESRKHSLRFDAVS